MTVAKNKNLFAVQADVCKALASPKRLEIIHLLSRSESHFASDLAEALGLAKANLSQHMRVLLQVGMVNSERKGNRVIYRIASPKIGEACQILREFIAERFARNGALLNDK